MAERRMFSKKVIGSDDFTDMPLSAQALYFHLSVNADDEGFINNPRQIQRAVGASRDDLTLLMSKRFIIPFDSGVVVIRHWRIHNYIQKDRFHDTLCTEEKALLTVLDSGEYTTDDSINNNVVAIMDTTCIQSVRRMDTEVRLGKDRLGEDSVYCDTSTNCIQSVNEMDTINEQKKNTRKFIKPTLEEIRDYCSERKNNIDPNKFYNHYLANGWRVGRNPMKDWKATIRYWESNEPKTASSLPTDQDYYAGAHTPGELLGR